MDNLDMMAIWIFSGYEQPRNASTRTSPREFKGWSACERRGEVEILSATLEDALERITAVKNQYVKVS
jgi:hypothetical protein